MLNNHLLIRTKKIKLLMKNKSCWKFKMMNKIQIILIKVVTSIQPEQEAKVLMKIISILKMRDSMSMINKYLSTFSFIFFD